MQRDYAYRKLQDLLLQELQNKQLLATQAPLKISSNSPPPKVFISTTSSAWSSPACPASRSPRPSSPCPPDESRPPSQGTRLEA